VLERFERPPKFINGMTFFDNDEFITSFVYNKGVLPIHTINGYLKRSWTAEATNNVTPDDLNVTLWHMIAEKSRGIPYLFNEVVDPGSRFWNIPLSDLNTYLGGFLGVPRRRIRLDGQNVYRTAYAKLRKQYRKLRTQWRVLRNSRGV
jgi:hypothetical protein